MNFEALHNLDLYQMAVQHPLSEAFFLARAYEELNNFEQASILREDFCGSAAVSLAWVMTDPNRHALAIDSDTPTLAYAQKQIDEQPDQIGRNVTLICDDVRRVSPPAVSHAHLIASLNFSTLIFKTEASLLDYFKRCLKNLSPGGIFVMDLFGGPGSQQVGIANRHMELDDDQSMIYHWEQRSYNPQTQDIDCRIHFTLPDQSVRRDAFVYDWRLWEVPQLLALMRQAGFAHREVWGEHILPDGQASGHYEAIDQLPASKDWVVYLIAQKH
jgi:cyclopropane fatty-acyl-phospholipid synthase-like methyltransferase